MLAIEVALPLGILAGALLLFGGGLMWAKLRDQQEKRRAAHDQQTQAILSLIEPWAGSSIAAKAWYQTYQISALGGATPAQLVEDGRADDVIEFIRHIEQGGYS